MTEVLLIVYLLIGFQMGGRTFHWGRKIRKQPSDFFIPLIAVPLLWPAFLLILKDFRRALHALLSPFLSFAGFGQLTFRSSGSQLRCSR